MKKLIIIAAAVTLLTSCAKEEAVEPLTENSCNCTYYSEERTTEVPTWVITYQSDWSASCESEDLGYSQFFHANGNETQTHTYINCK